ncbi:MAG: 50S ribosomal protein L25/general stress protein Ctc [Chlamydiae bacterium]|nr:50S ribosomal protein L25/general stress protein Ctc [Chlamydiota bacterium]
MKLTVIERVGHKKSDVKEVRRKGDIPAILYSPGTECENIIISGTEFSTVLREIQPGMLPTTVFQLNKGGKSFRAIVKDIQYHPTTYRVLHLDFERLHDDVPVSVKVPVRFTGAAECTGIKLGGFLRQISRYVKVQCLPKDLPTEFFVDVRDLGIRQSKRLSDITLPKGVKALAAPSEVIVVVAKR